MGENWQSFRQMGGPQSPQGINPDTDLNKKQKTKNKKQKTKNKKNDHLPDFLTLRPKKKKLFGCPPPPAPNFWKLEKSFYCTKVYRPRGGR